MTTSQRILEVLPTGSANAMTVQELSTLLNIDSRNFRAIINALRLDGVPIASSAAPPHGLFIAQSKAELKRFLTQERNRASSTLAMVMNLEENLQDEYFHTL